MQHNCIHDVNSLLHLRIFSEKMLLRKSYGNCLKSSDDGWKLLDGEDTSYGYIDNSFGLDLDLSNRIYPGFAA